MYFDIISSKDNDYPIFKFVNSPKDTPECITLLDSGAYFPVWCGFQSLLLTMYPDAHDTGCFKSLGGFGGAGNLAPIWVIPKYELSDGTDTVVYNDLLVAVYPIQGDVSMIVSCSMLQYVDMTYSRHGKATLSLNFKHKSLTVKSRKSKILPNTIDKIFVLAQSKARTLAELLTDTELFTEAKNTGLNIVDFYTCLQEIVHGTTDLTNEELLQQVKLKLLHC